MSNGKSTPGPWLFKPETDDEYAAIVSGDIEVVTFDNFESAPIDADIRLMVAAPDLLVACKFALSQLEAAGIVCGDVRNVIAKAEGRES